MREIDYDKKFDVLYIRLGDMSNAIGDEDPDGIVVHRDMTTGELRGITVFNFLKSISTGSAPALKLPENITYEKDILPVLRLH